MEERKSFLFYRSFWSGGSKLKPRERLAFYDALAQYAFTGQETSLPHNAAICWEFAKPLIDSNNKKYADGSKGGRPQKTTGFDDDITTGSDSLKNISEDSPLNRAAYTLHCHYVMTLCPLLAAGCFVIMSGTVCAVLFSGCVPCPFACDILLP